MFPKRTTISDPIQLSLFLLCEKSSHSKPPITTNQPSPILPDGHIKKGVLRVGVNDTLMTHYHSYS